MTNSDLTLIASLLDRSGSMETSKKATEDGWAEFINQQRMLPGRCLVTLAQFDTEYEMVYKNRSVSEATVTVTPRGMTALLDATGKFITEVGEELAAMSEADRPGKVVCIVMTDGQENSSHEWRWDTVQKLIKQQRDLYNWQFIFIGAKMDAVKVGARMGFATGQTITYNNDSYEGTFAVAAATSNMVSGLRTAGKMAGYTDEDRAEAMGQKKSSSPTK